MYQEIFPSEWFKVWCQKGVAEVDSILNGIRPLALLKHRIFKVWVYKSLLCEQSDFQIEVQNARELSLGNFDLSRAPILCVCNGSILTRLHSISRKKKTLLFSL